MKDWQLESQWDGKEGGKKAVMWNFGCIVNLQICVSGAWNNSPGVQ